MRLRPSVLATKVMATSKPEYPGKLLQAAAIAKPFQEVIESDIKQRSEAGRAIPKLVGILAKPSPPSIAYAEWTRKACVAVGINFEIWKTWEDAEQESVASENGASESLQNFGLEADVEDLILAANRDKSVDGVMVRMRVCTDFAGILPHLWRAPGHLPAADCGPAQGRRGPQLLLLLEPVPQRALD